MKGLRARARASLDSLLATQTVADRLDDASTLIEIFQPPPTTTTTAQSNGNGSGQDSVTSVTTSSSAATAPAPTSTFSANDGDDDDPSASSTASAAAPASASSATAASRRAAYEEVVMRREAEVHRRLELQHDQDVQTFEGQAAARLTDALEQLQAQHRRRLEVSDDEHHAFSPSRRPPDCTLSLSLSLSFSLLLLLLLLIWISHISLLVIDVCLKRRVLGPTTTPASQHHRPDDGLVHQRRKARARTHTHTHMTHGGDE